MILNSESKRTEYLEKIMELDLKKHKYKVTCDVISEKRTISQNNLHFARLNQIELETGQPANLLHKDYKERFIFFENETPPNYPFVLIPRKRKGFMVNGVLVKEEKSTTILDTKQFKKFLDLIEDDFYFSFPKDEYGIKLIDPADRDWQERLDYYEEELKRLRTFQ
jgi:hypothetical protein